jgi:PAS domain S-box-containing protein
MLTRFMQWLRSPEFTGDEEMSTMANILNTMGLLLFGVLILTAVIFVPLFATRKLESWVIILLMMGLFLIARRYIYQGKLETSALILTIPAWVMFYVVAAIGGGINSPLMPIILTMTIVISFIVRSRWKYIFLVLGICCAFILATLQTSVSHPQQFFLFSPIAAWFLFTMALIFVHVFVDITITNLRHSLNKVKEQNNARLEAEKALLRSKEEFQKFMQFFPGLVYIKDYNGRVLFANHGFETYLGLDPEKMIGKTDLMIFGDKFGKKIHADDLRILETESQSTIEEEFSGRTWSTHKFSINNPGLEPVLGGVTIDITERKQVEKKLKESEYFFKESQRAAFIGSYYADFAGDHWDSSEILDQIFGIDETYIRSVAGWLDLIHPDDQEMMTKYLNDEVMGNRSPFNKEYRIIRKSDGETRWVLGLGQVIIDPNDTVIALIGTIQDITERKRTEEALRESEARFGNMFSSVTSVAVQGFKPDGTIRFWNKASELLYGYSLEEAIGRNLFDLIVPAQIQDQLKDCLDQLLKTGVLPPPTEYSFKRKDESRVDVISSPAIAHSSFHEPDLYCIDIDIAERKKAEKELARSQALVKAIVDNTTDMVWSVDPDTFGLQTWNPTYEKYFLKNRHLSVQVGMRPEELYPAESGYVELWRENYQKAIREGSFISEYKVFSTPDILQISLHPLTQDGHIFGISVFGEIITERKKVEERIEMSEKKYRELFQVNKDGISIHFQPSATEFGNFVEVNKAAPKMLGYTQVEMLNLTPLDLEPAVSDEVLIFREAELENFNTVDYETVYRTKSGNHVHVEISAQKILYDGKPAIMSIIRDITDRKQHESELQAIATLSSALRTAPGRDEMLPVIVDQIVNLLDCDCATIEIIEPETGDVIVEAAHGMWEKLIGTRQKSGTGINAIINATRKPFITKNLEKDPQSFFHSWARYGIQGTVGVPLIAQEQLIGFIWIGRKNEITHSEVRLLGAITDIAANAIYRTTLHEQTEKDATELAEAYETTLEGWANALELREQETAGHSKRVVKYTLELAQQFGFKSNDLVHIRRGASLHDIGKMGIPDKILLKNGELTSKEWEIMRQHPIYAHRLLSQIPYLKQALEIPHFHHERWDGSGYPDHLKGEEIPLAARIFAVIDVWDAL